MEDERGIEAREITGDAIQDARDAEEAEEANREAPWNQDPWWENELPEWLDEDDEAAREFDRGELDRF